MDMLRRLEPAAGQSRTEFDENLNALRGWAAVLVVLYHFVAGRRSLPAGFEGVGGGRGPVLLFFVISGYVIGLCYRRPWLDSEAGPYWGRRAVRLVPLYLIALGLSLVVMGRPFNWLTLGSHLLFVQNFEPYGSVHLPPILSNGSLWTLAYEMAYYGLFLLVWRGRPAAVPSFAALFILALAGLVLPPGEKWISSLAAGYIFWLSGLVIAWFLPQQIRKPFPFFGLLLLLLGCEQTEPLKLLLAPFHRDLSTLPLICVTDLAYLPFCFFLVASATGRDRGLNWKWLWAAAWLCFILSVVLAVKTAGWNPRIAWALTYTVAGTALLWVPISGKVVRLGSWLGGISYALYLVHQPILNGFRKFAPAFEPAHPYAAMALGIGLSLLLAAVLEHLVQPKIARWLRGDRAGRGV
jgi:peptidoglycan/LPS O-acetylase OafA/YrhL